MKYVLLLFAFLNIFFLSAQHAEKDAVQKTIEDFFEGFHQQDSMRIKNTVHPDIVMQTIGKDSLGNTILKHEKFNLFLNSIVSIPKTKKFEEKILSYVIQIDGKMANVWTSYEFWIDDTFSHCGVNSFQLLKEANRWKIIYIIDTRRKEDCKK
tara:strand:+ start:64540 stop:64998 length:459 start_codon:yes stop_codon:yes gene_type:complete